MFGIGIQHPKTTMNIGTLFRSAHAFGASMLFTIGPWRYSRQASDTTNAIGQIPYVHYRDAEDFKACRPVGVPLIGVELAPNARALPTFAHPRSALYLLGAEDHGITPDLLAMCQYVVQIPGARCLNVSAAGSIVLYDREAKAARVRLASVVA